MITNGDQNANVLSFSAAREPATHVTATGSRTDFKTSPRDSVRPQGAAVSKPLRRLKIAGPCCVPLGGPAASDGGSYNYNERVILICHSERSRGISAVVAAAVASGRTERATNICSAAGDGGSYNFGAGLLS